ncbi:SUMF1/EgtB/PvdO family nonheme iron enzyme [Haliscomenobacter hydrossis]|uniref:Sulphatase-modifying factor protein n=1 Tax=Haliscomenobacter hydrossis (strain ATCC 27775 / DSM 1100 / LMG 10767 / O) TaxID=760192 RepID=F4KVQ1_HALH1|nr:SUMF1/EgtB/PvdO family nonheme iron enzyme [Haliscomenobacter hydrossis]AEE52508.1 Sulphatase-modifying factor protein [Haliscomenobacter hydrossis DSM 1100]
MKRFPILLFLAFTICNLCHAQRTGKDYAVFFYVADFQPGWVPLPETAIEAATLQAELSTNFNFICEMVPNPSKQQIREKIREYNERLTPNDQVFFFFSMHGYYAESADRGYLVANDGLVNDPYGYSYFSYDDLRADLGQCRAKHIMLALDACYSGSFGIRDKSGPDAPIYEKKEDCATRISRTMQYQGRQYCSAGNKNAKTPAKSLFAARFLEALRKGGEGGIISFHDLIYWINKVDNPKPEGGSFQNHSPGGDFLFVKKAVCNQNFDREKDIAAWNKAKQEDYVESYKNYLHDFPQGEFHQLAISAIKQHEEKAAQFHDDQAWQIALKHNSILFYQKYQRDFPNGLHFTDANRRIKNLKSPDDGLILVVGGTFSMGCINNNKQGCDDDEKPAHLVTLNDFYLSPYEVTQKQWQQVMGYNPSYFKNCDECPVENVSWEDVQKFIEKLNAQTGKRYRLPTEAEWEYAAREGGKQVLFGNGKNIADANEINFDGGVKQSNSIIGTYRAKTTKVGTFFSNKIGLYDMSGNVWEWCNDWKGEYGASPQNNPIGSSSGEYRVCRGGSWIDTAQSIRVDNRSVGLPSHRTKYLGFRLARTP